MRGRGVGLVPVHAKDETLTLHIKTIHERSRRTYGVPRVHAELRDQGICVGRKRVARLMRAAGLEGVSRRKGTRTTFRDRDAHAVPDLTDCGWLISPISRPGPDSFTSQL